MNKSKRLHLQQMLCATLLTMSVCTSQAFAADNIDAEIQNQQKILQELNRQKSEQANQEVIRRIGSLEDKLNKLNTQPAYNAEGAIDALAAQIDELRQQIAAAEADRAKIMETLNQLQKQQSSSSMSGDDYHGTAATTKYLVNPGQGQVVSYTQDAINSQGNSTMVFSYAPNQLYKIYCRRGYLTDMVFKKGENITYVGGGDTAGWAVSNTTVDGTPHLFIKPVVETSTTNLIVTTDKRSYQLILNTSDWYNPIVSWVYEAEAQNANLIEQKKNERTVTGNISAANVEDLDFNYEISGEGDNKPVMVFSDGEQTYIKFKKLSKNQIPLFIRQKGRREMALVNYRIKDNYYIVEKVFDKAQFKDADGGTITIQHK